MGPWNPGRKYVFCDVQFKSSKLKHTNCNYSGTITLNSTRILWIRPWIESTQFHWNPINNFLIHHANRQTRPKTPWRREWQAPLMSHCHDMETWDGFSSPAHCMIQTIHDFLWHNNNLLPKAEVMKESILSMLLILTVLKSPVVLRFDISSIRLNRGW